MKQDNVKQEKKERHSFGHVSRNLYFMLRYSFKYAPSYTFVTLGEALGRGGWHVLQVLFIKYLFDAIEAGVEFKTVLFWSLLVVGYNISFELFNKWRLEVYRPRIRLVLHEGIQNELYKKARELDQSCYDDPEFYNDFIWAIREADNRTGEIMENFSIFINRVVSSAVILVLLATMDWIVAVTLAVAVGLGFVFRNKLNKVNYKKNEELNPITRKLSYIGRVFYLPDHQKELRQGEIAEHLQEEYQRTTGTRVACIEKYAGKVLALSLIIGFLSDLIPHTGIVAYLVIRFLVDPGLSLGSFSASITATFKLFWTINDIGNYLTKFHEHSLYIEKVRKFVGYRPTIKGDVTGVPAFDTLSVRGLSFAYPFSKDGKEALSGIDLEIKRGEKVAFVGYNGAGKTTLIKLLMRLYDATEGKILYNGQDITAFSPAEYRKHIGAVFQDYTVFAATVGENVMGGEYTEADEPAVRAALTAAAFDDKLGKLPNGVNTQLTTEFSKDGVGLSGGEAQKIAIARVFARPYELIVMDEPSSALDPIAEYRINQSIIRQAESKTVIFISHRLSTTRMADRIYMFDNGKIVGKHQLSSCPLPTRPRS